MNQFLRLAVCAVIFIVILSLFVLLHFSQFGEIVYGRSLQGWLVGGCMFGAMAAVGFYFEQR